MSYLTDTEKRLLFSALSREKEVCKQVDKECCREPYEQSLESVVKGLERKFYYDRFEKEIRNKAIDEFAERLKFEHKQTITTESVYIGRSFDEVVDEIAEEMKGGE